MNTNKNHDDASGAENRFDAPRLSVGVTGASGLLGRALCTHLAAANWAVRPLKRNQDWVPNAPSEGPRQDIKGGLAEQANLAGLDAVVHLAGEPIMGRWTRRKKTAIVRSRVDGTKAIASACVHHGVKTLVCGTAVGYYGSAGDQTLTEQAERGTGFLAETCQAWEQAAAVAVEAGVRVVFLRTGVVLSPDGGALKLMLPIFKLGLGGRMGNGRHYLPWIAIDDWVRATRHLLEHEGASGPFNLTAPSPVTNAAFTQTLASVLRRPAVLPVPVLAPRLILGEVVDEALVSSTRAVPEALLESGFAFGHADLAESLRQMLALA